MPKYFFKPLVACWTPFLWWDAKLSLNAGGWGRGLVLADLVFQTSLPLHGSPYPSGEVDGGWAEGGVEGGTVVGL